VFFWIALVSCTVALGVVLCYLWVVSFGLAQASKAREKAGRGVGGGRVVSSELKFSGPSEAHPALSPSARLGSMQKHRLITTYVKKARLL